MLFLSKIRSTVSERISYALCTSCSAERCIHIAAVAVHAYGVRKLRISNILEYVGYLPDTTKIDYEYAVKTIDRAENALASDHLKDFSSAVSDGWYRGDVLSSMKKDIRKVEVHNRFYVKVIVIVLFLISLVFGPFQIHVENLQKIVASQCSCPLRTVSRCHHVAIVALYISKNISPTDVPCAWKKTKRPNTEAVQSMRI